MKLALLPLLLSLLCLPCYSDALDALLKEKARREAKAKAELAVWFAKEAQSLAAANPKAMRLLVECVLAAHTWTFTSKGKCEFRFSGGRCTYTDAGETFDGKHATREAACEITSGGQIIIAAGGSKMILTGIEIYSMAPVV